jgi:translation initiation factor 1
MMQEGFSTSKKISIRKQQRTGKKSITIIQGLPNDLDLQKILRAMKKCFQCNGSTSVDEKFGEVIMLSGDKMVDVYEFMIENEICERDELVLHG